MPTTEPYRTNLRAVQEFLRSKPDPFTLEEMVQKVGKKLGKPLGAINLYHPLESYMERLRDTGVLHQQGPVYYF